MPRLTRRLIAATEPGKHDIILRDDTLPGFHVRIRKGGSKTYFLYYRTQAGKERRVKIARCDELIPEKAREIARDLLESVRRGEDPAAERRAQRRAAPPEAYQEAVEDYITREQIGRRGNATAAEVRRTLLREGSAWVGLPVREITAAEVRKRLEEIRDGRADKRIRPRPYLANRTYAYLLTFFAWCAEPGIDKVPMSPMLGLKRPWRGERKRTRVYSDEEIKALWAAAEAIAADENLRTAKAWGAYLKVIILTGKRRGALASMRWDELDAHGVWRPAIESRRERSNKRRHITPLPKLVQRIISGTPKKEGNPYVFSGRRQGAHIDPGSPLVDAIKAFSGVSDFFLHACRHTAETRLAQLRVPPHIRDMVLDHEPVRGSGEGYDHYEYEDEMREALETWAGYVEGLITAEGVRVLR